MKHRWKFLILVLVLLLGGVAWFVGQLVWPAPDVVVSKETTWLTEPLDADGFPDYAGYLLGEQKQGVTPENNGAIPFLQALWPAGMTEEHRELVCREIGMEVPQENGMTEPKEDEALKDRVRVWLAEVYPLPEEEEGEESGTDDELAGLDEMLAGLVESAHPDHQILDLFAAAADRPWRREEFPPLAEWIDRHAGNYELLHQAAAWPKFYAPEPTLLANPHDALVSMELPAVQTMRTASKCLALRGYRHLGEGDLMAAWRDCETIYRLSGHVPPGTLVTELVAYAMNFHAGSLCLAILDSAQLTPELAREILEFHQKRALREGIEEAIDRGERLMMITTVLQLAGARGEGASISDVLGTEGVNPVESLPVDWNIVLRECNSFYDRLVAAMRTTDRTERDRAIAELEYEFNNLEQVYLPNPYASFYSREARSRGNAGIMLALFVPAASAATTAEGRYFAMAQLSEVAAALAVHRLAEGEYPESLESLTPDLLKEPPVDRYGNRLAYRRTDDGYFLYSMGANGTNDEGSNDLMQVYQGYSIEENDEEAAVRELLGLPPLGTETTVVDEFNGEEIVVEGSLSKKIPYKVDDHAIRLPLPRLKLPLPESPPPHE